VHPYVLDVMRMRAWDPLEVRGLRTTAALAAARDDAEESVIFMDELTCTNAGAAPGSIVSVGRAEVVSAVAVELSGVPSEDLEPELLRLALLGKVVGVGDGVALIPQDFSRPRHASDDLHRVVSAFHRSLGEDWQSVDVEVARTDPRGLVRITMETRIELDGRLVTATSSTPLGDAAAGEWPGLEDQLPPNGALRSLVQPLGASRPARHSTSARSAGDRAAWVGKGCRDPSRCSRHRGPPRPGVGAGAHVSRGILGEGEAGRALFRGEQGEPCGCDDRGRRRGGSERGSRPPASLLSSS
jgi:hypothetical protein